MGNDKAAPGSFSTKEQPEESHPLFALDVLAPGCDAWSSCPVLIPACRWSLQWAERRDGKTGLLGNISEPVSQPSLALNFLTMRYCVGILLKTLRQDFCCLQPKAP